MKELDGLVGLGQPQVTSNADRLDRSVAVASMASLLLRKRRAQDSAADRPWRAFRLQRGFLGGDAGAVGAFGPSNHSQVVPAGQSRMMTSSSLSLLSELLHSQARSGGSGYGAQTAVPEWGQRAGLVCNEG
jgi:hypothetical protein